MQILIETKLKIYIKSTGKIGKINNTKYFLENTKKNNGSKKNIIHNLQKNLNLKDKNKLK